MGQGPNERCNAMGKPVRALEKKWRRCLKCNRKVFTDCGHRLCAKCRDDNQNLYEPRVVRVDMDDFGEVADSIDELFGDGEVDYLEVVDILSSD